MTALAIIVASTEAVVATDGGCFGPDGSLGVTAGKVLLIPEASTIATARGVAPAFDDLSDLSRRATERLHFDLMLEIVPSYAERAAALRERPADDPAERSEYLLAGWSEARQAHEAWAVRMWDSDAALAFTPYRLPECHVAPEVPPEMAERFGLLPPSSGERQWRNDPVRYAAQSLAALRFCPGPVPGAPEGHAGAVVVGAFVQVSRVTRHFITSEIVQEWPDPVGRPVDPDASLYGPDGQVTAERVFGPMGRWKTSHAA